MEAHEMFKKANRVTRLDKALILGFMAGYRDNPRPNSENVVTIKLNESKVSTDNSSVLYDLSNCRYARCNCILRKAEIVDKPLFLR